MNNSRLWGTQTTLGLKLKALNVMNSSGVLMLLTAHGYGWHEQLWVMSSGL